MALLKDPVHHRAGRRPVVNADARGVLIAHVPRVNRCEHNRYTHAAHRLAALVHARAQQDEAGGALLSIELAHRVELIVLLVDVLEQERRFEALCALDHLLRNVIEKCVSASAHDDRRKGGLGVFEVAGVAVLHKAAFLHHIHDLFARLLAHVRPSVEHAGHRAHRHAGLARHIANRINLHAPSSISFCPPRANAYSHYKRTACKSQAVFFLLWIQRLPPVNRT